MAQEDREAYIAWLRDEVGWHCNSRGCYEAFWDYDDSVTPDQMAEACANYEEAGFASPLNYLDESIMEEPGFIEALENELISAITRDAATAPEGVGEQWVESGDIWGDLESAGYEGIDANVEDLLSNSSFNVNVFFATEAEENFDMGSIVHAFGNDYRDPRLEDVDAEDLDNALSYLVNQQGHSIAEVYGNGDNAFIRSVREQLESYTECGTYKDYGFGFHAKEGSMSSYVIGEPVEEGWWVLVGNYDLTDSDSDYYISDDLLNELLYRHGYPSMDALKESQADMWRNELTAIIAEAQEDSRFEVPFHLSSDESMLRHIVKRMGVPEEAARTAVANARAMYEKDAPRREPEKVVTLKGEVDKARRASAKLADNGNHSNRGQDAR